MRPAAQSHVDLHQRLRALEDIEAIVRLKAAYWRSVDLKKPDDALACLTHDVVIDFDGIPPSRGRDAFAAILRAGAARLAAFDMHHGSNPIIRLMDSDRAEGQWSIGYCGIDAPHRLLIRMAGEYRDIYVREASGWRIAAMAMRQKYLAMREVGADGTQTQLRFESQAGFNPMPD